MSDELSDEAKAEIRAAIAIVREDKFEAFARERLAKHTEKPTEPVKDPTPEVPPVPPKNDPPVPPKNDPPVPPPPSPNPPPPNDPPPKRVSRYWGELDD